MSEGNAGQNPAGGEVPGNYFRAGLNLPYIFVKLAFGEPYPEPARKLNPLPVVLAWGPRHGFPPGADGYGGDRGGAAERRGRLPR